jgi:hypothetical protein
MGLRPSKDHSIDRINNELGYYPENCRWATILEQARNQRKNVFLTFEGETKCLTEWATLRGLKVPTVFRRFYEGLSPEKVLSKERLKP